jgi:glycosyltransferase involved in cell wall biosynthesis
MNAVSQGEATVPFDKHSPTVWHIGGEDVHMRIPLLLALRERGFEVGAVGSGTGDEFQVHGIPYYRYSLERWINPWADLRSCVQLNRLFRAARPDIVHAFDTKPVIFVPAMARNAGISGTVSTVTGMGYVFSSTSLVAQILRPVYRTLQRWASAATHATVFQNPDDREYYLKNGMTHAGRDVLVRSSGIDIDGLTGRLPDEKSLAQLARELDLDGKIVVTMVARLIAQKGVREFINAANAIAQQRSDIVFLLVGPASSEGAQAIPIREVQDSVVRYLGPRTDVPALLAISHLFVLPSYYGEGVPRVLLEAGAMGLPLITTDMPGCREAVRDGWNGMLVPPRDAEALSSAILRVLSSDSERASMGDRSRSYTRAHFDLSSVADEYAKIYLSVWEKCQCGNMSASTA